MSLQIGGAVNGDDCMKNLTAFVQRRRRHKRERTVPRISRIVWARHSATTGSLKSSARRQARELEFRENRSKSKIEDLEGRIVELIDRSGNELRIKQGLEEQMETELEARRRSLKVEFGREMRSNEDRWQGERRRLTVEIERLKKKLAVRKPVPPPSFIDKLFSRGDH